ncbi:40S ribosomal protein S5-1 [Hordeum vulgare]|nr:40S ribosomal protein S5-1 [Hordeum vulgare]
MAKSSKVYPTLNPNVSHDDDIDDNEDENNHEESENIASFKLKGEMIFKSLHKNNLIRSNFMEIMSIAIEDKKYIKELEAHLEEHEATIETMGGHDKIFENVINPYLAGVLQHPQSIEMREGMLHIRDVEGPKKTGSMEARLEAMEQQVFKCQGMVERGLNAKHMMITEFTNKHKIDANDIGKHLSRLYDRIDHLQAQIYDPQN